MKKMSDRERERERATRLVEIILRASFHLFMLLVPLSLWPSRGAPPSSYTIPYNNNDAHANRVRKLFGTSWAAKNTGCEGGGGWGVRAEYTQRQAMSYRHIHPTLFQQQLLNEVADVGDTWSSFRVISSCVLMFSGKIVVSLSHSPPPSIFPFPVFFWSAF